MTADQRSASNAAPDATAAEDSEAFLAMAVHELRGSVGVLVGSTQTLEHLCRGAELPTGARELLAMMGERGRHLAELVSDLLTSAYLADGSTPLVLERVALHPLVTRAVLGPDTWDGRLVVECDRNLSVTVDVTRLEHVLHNLVANAFDHGEAPVRVTVQRPDDDGIRIFVSDRGTGVGPDEAEHLFERFSRLSSKRSSSTGLGLSIARGLARAMGGDLAYERMDPGSRFVLTLPEADPRSS